MPNTWQPACNLSHLRHRAQMLKTIRLFFDHRDVLEVETPLLCSATGTDPQLDFFSSHYHCVANTESAADKRMFLQTSPEFAMKRLLAAGSGSIFQICKAFRNSELGRHHNPEFTILEWYRVGYSLSELINEVTELIAELTNNKKSPYKISYADLFEQTTGLNALEFCPQSYRAYALKNGLEDAIGLCENNHSLWLDFLFSYQVQPTLKQHPICIVYEYPAIQASLARINTKNPNVADRFEVFVQGIEIGNGFFELSDAGEQEKRFDQENSSREKMGLPQVKKDQHFLNALKSGLPECSGIALGLDRLLMIMTETQSLNDVITFPFDRA